jgi:hypothetical protein
MEGVKEEGRFERRKQGLSRMRVWGLDRRKARYIRVPRSY